MDSNELLIKIQDYIHEEQTGFTKRETFPVVNPATGNQITTVLNLGRADAEVAIDTAAEALEMWKANTGKERSNKLKAWFDLVVSNTECLAEIITFECGKPIRESRSEVAYGASFIEWFAEEAKRVYGDTIPATARNQRILTIKQPIGVCTAITPWNFPLAMITRKAAPALAAGCTIVIKPAVETPLTALALAYLAKEAGLPQGVLNIITSRDSRQVGEAFCESPHVGKLSFTGSTNTGRILAKQCAGTIKNVSLELGGTAPFIIFDDATIENAVSGLLSSKFRNAGQTCVCANIVLVQEGIYDTFVNKLVSKVSEIKVGNGYDETTDLGPLINSAAIEKVDDLVKDALSKGATCLIGGRRSERLFFEPTVLIEITPEMRISYEEIFGPVIPIIKFKKEREAIEIANRSIYGLAAYFYSDNVNRCLRVSESLEYGMVGINEGIISTEVAPFGGVKQSGIGREGSKYGIDEYTELKYICCGNVS